MSPIMLTSYYAPYQSSVVIIILQKISVDITNQGCKKCSRALAPHDQKLAVYKPDLQQRSHA